MIAKSQKDAIVSVSDDGVYCKLCKVTLEKIGIHFKKIHGMEYGHTRSEILEAFDLPRGTRLASRRVREESYEFVMNTFGGAFPGAVFIKKGECSPRDHVSHIKLKRSAAEIAHNEYLVETGGPRKGKKLGNIPHVCTKCGVAGHNLRTCITTERAA